MSDNTDLSSDRGLGFAAISAEASNNNIPKFRSSKPVVIADLNDNPPEEEADDEPILQTPLFSRSLFLSVYSSYALFQFPLTSL